MKRVLTWLANVWDSRPMAKVKWAVAALWAGLLFVLAILYGKQTVQVLRARIGEKERAARSLQLELAAAEKRAKMANGSAEAHEAIEKVTTLNMRLDEIRKAKAKAERDSGGTELTDDELAVRDNARRVAARRPAAG
jgi:hypothetical protein